MLKVSLLGIPLDEGIRRALSACGDVDLTVTDSADADLLLAPPEFLAGRSDSLLSLDELVPEDLFPAAAPPRRQPPTALTVRLDPRLLYYRTELLEDRREREAFAAINRRELAVPAGWAEFVAAAHFFTRPPQLYGCVFAGTPAGLARFFSEVVCSLGGAPVDGRARPNLLTREGEAAAALLYDLVARFSTTPPELLELDEAAAAEWFRRGRAALAPEGPTGYRRTTDTSFSAVAGWLGLAPLPGAKSARRTTAPRRIAVAVPRGGQAEAAREVAAALVSDTGQAALAYDAGVPARRSAALAAGAGLREGTLAQRRWRLMEAAAESAVPLVLPPEPAWSRGLGEALQAMLRGEVDARDALRQAEEELKRG